MERGKVRATSVIFLIAVLLLSVIAIASPLARADDCTVTVTAPASIQSAVDLASPGDVVCLSGTFSQSVTFGPEDSGLTLRGLPGAVMDGSGPADLGTTIDPNAGIKLLDNTIDIEIVSLELRGYSGVRGSGISAWGVSTSDVRVVGNYIHDNAWNGILVGSEGDFFHSDWEVERNRVDNNGFVNIELTNCEDCSIEENTVDGRAGTSVGSLAGFSLFGIVVQARHTRVPPAPPVVVRDVEIEDNTVTGTTCYGIYVLSFTGITGPPFTPVPGSVLLEEVEVEGNTITDVTGGPTCTGTGIIYWAFNGGATILEGSIEDNKVNCLSSSGKPSILVLEAGTGPGTVRDTELEDNTIDSDCGAPFADPGTTEVEDEDDDEDDD